MKLKKKKNISYWISFQTPKWQKRQQSLCTSGMTLPLPHCQIHFLTMNQSPFAPLFAFVYFENRPLTRASTGISQSRRKTLDWLFPDKLIEDKKASEHQQNGGNLRLFGRVGGSEILGNFSRA